jgi:hypothetical protein
MRTRERQASEIDADDPIWTLATLDSLQPP